LKTNSYRYVKKAIPIEAFKYEGDLSANSKYCVPSWAIEAYENGILYYKETDDSSSELFAKTLEGDMLCEVGCYIIQGVEGEIYPCRSDIFDKTYEKVKNGISYKPYTNEEVVDNAFE
jgi:hypothetical protein